jgi:hypothetical protein
MENFIADLEKSGSTTSSSTRPLTMPSQAGATRWHDKPSPQAASFIPSLKGKSRTKDKPVQLYSAIFARALDDKVPDPREGGDQLARRGRIRPRFKSPGQSSRRQKYLPAKGGVVERNAPLSQTYNSRDLSFPRQGREQSTYHAPSAASDATLGQMSRSDDREYLPAQKQADSASAPDWLYTIEPRQGYVLLNWPKATLAPDMISYARLREMCKCAKCVHSSTKQRLHTPKEIHDDMVRGGWMNGVPDPEMLREEGRSIFIRWDKEGEHRVALDKKALLKAVFPTTPRVFTLQSRYSRVTWRDEAELLSSVSPIEYSTRHFGEDGSFKDQQLLAEAVQRLQTHGYVRLKSVPTDATDNANCALRYVAESIGPIRQTFYGELWDVKNKPNSTNVAYTDLNLGLHMDLLYV